MPERWVPGQDITLRYTGIYDGETKGRPGLMHGFPCSVVEDRADLLALWIPAGVQRHFIDLADRGHEVSPVPWTLDSLRLMFPGKAYAIWLFWGNARAISEPPDHFREWERIREEQAIAEGRTSLRAGEFLGWYVNLEAPFVRTSIGVDTSDNSLDVEIAADRSWHWRDEHLTQLWEDMEVFTRADTEGFYAAGREAVALLEARSFPFDGSFVDWKPPQHWPLPSLHPEWDSTAGYDIVHTTGRRLANVESSESVTRA